ncbi:hypothetical protein EV207_10130 [Scopulibacillus darangshiensis]|uniref:Uncharacterized protein n=1 Tax=Scopulibacillus darangshiensis TaxID=442528 RepID=A0A4R2PCD0_9BACL|nr:hypothetical protein [Scopulibacillus darangshiensis]TCP32058.1 hypothetical protein EV207_10130 [Scopulibacillus darangshiensis]
MPKNEKERFTQDQIEELAGGYKQSDNRMPKRKRSVVKGDGIATKRPQ